MPNKAKIYKSMKKMMDKSDPNSAVTDAEYRAATKKLRANERKNKKEYKKQNR